MSRSTGLRSIWVFLMAVAILGMASSLQAAPIALSNYGCSAPNPSDCNGHTYAVWAENLGSNDWLINVGVKPGAGGAIFAIAIKSFATSYTLPNGNVDDALVGVPDGDLNNWVISQQELNANGCTGGGSGGLCTEYYNPNGLAFSSGASPLIWTFKVNAPAGLNDTLHLKYMFVNGVDRRGNPKKVGSLGSFDVSFACGITNSCDGGAPPPPTVPEPSTMGLLGAGLIGLALFARKRIS